MKSNRLRMRRSLRPISQNSGTWRFVSCSRGGYSVWFSADGTFEGVTKSSGEPNEPYSLIGGRCCQMRPMERGIALQEIEWFGGNLTDMQLQGIPERFWVVTKPFRRLRNWRTFAFSATIERPDEPGSRWTSGKRTSWESMQTKEQQALNVARTSA